jgi:hypothetical protein
MNNLNKHFGKSISGLQVVPAGFISGSIANVGNTDATVLLSISDAVLGENEFVLKPNMVYNFDFVGKPYGEVQVNGTCELMFIY